MTIKIIDAHNHPNWHGFNIDKLVRNMDELGIKKTWLLSWESTISEFDSVPKYNAIMDPRSLCAPLWMVVEGLQKYPDRFVGGWAPDPRDRFAREKLISAVKLHGIKICGELKLRMLYDSPDALAMFDLCGELGLPVLFHLQAAHNLQSSYNQPSGLAWPEWYGGDFDVVERICAKCPNTNFIGHGPSFWAAISNDPNPTQSLYPSGKVIPGKLSHALRTYPNLFCDISAGSGCNALSRDLDHAAKFLTEFQDRVIFGRDYFDRAQLDILEKLRIPESVLHKILSVNACRLIHEQ